MTAKKKSIQALRRAVSETFSFKNIPEEGLVPINHDLEESSDLIIDLDFSFPKPREQDVLENGQYISAASQVNRRRKAIKYIGRTCKENEKLLQAILKGEKEDQIIKKIENAGGTQTLMRLKLRIRSKASHKTVCIFVKFRSMIGSL